MRSILFIFFLILTVFSCSKDANYEYLENEHTQNSIEKYLNSIKTNDIEKNKKIDLLIKGIDKNKLSSARISSNENLIILNVNSLDGFKENEDLKVVFRANAGEIVYGELISFEDNRSDHTELANKIYASFFKGEDYTGTISIYDINQKLRSKNEVVNGKIIRSGLVVPKKEQNAGGRIKSCDHYYYIEKITNQDGITTTTYTYLWSECYDDDPNSPGPGPSTPKPNQTNYYKGPMFPTNVSNGDRYGHNEGNGRLTEYIYNGAKQIWEIYQVTLPNAYVNANVWDYPDLALGGPVPNGYQIVTDFMYYTYNAYSASWTGVQMKRGAKPVKEYESICEGLQEIWNNFPNNEAFGFITPSGKFIHAATLSLTGGEAPKVVYDAATNTSYYAYPDSYGPPSLIHGGMLHHNQHYFIPVVASVHTHSPCRQDGTNGVSHPVGDDDKAYANNSSKIRHWVIGCNAIARYTSKSYSFIDVQNGPLSTKCSVVY